VQTSPPSPLGSGPFQLCRWGRKGAVLRPQRSLAGPQAALRGNRDRFISDARRLGSRAALGESTSRCCRPPPRAAALGCPRHAKSSQASLRLARMNVEKAQFTDVRVRQAIGSRSDVDQM